MRKLAIVAFVLLALSANAQYKRPKIGLALSGGGAKGCAHVGVLRQLEKMHVPVDYISGTSMGAVVGALYASGMTPDEIEKELTSINWEEVLTDATAFEHLIYRRKYEETRYPSTVEVGIRKGKLVLPSGIKTGQKLSFLLSSYLLPQLDERDFSKLPIPYTAVATDLETGDPFVLAKGDLAEAVRASMSIPGAFTPVQWEDGKILVDGGVTMNVPVTVVRAMGADVVIAVDIASGLSKREELNSTRGVLGQLSSFLTRKNMEKQLADADVVLSPKIEGFGVFDFGKSAEIVKLGDTEAIAKKDLLVKYAIDPAEHAALVQKRHVPRVRNVRVDDIRVEGLHFVEEQFIRDQMKTKPGEMLDMEKLRKDVEWLYGWGDFIGIHAGLDTTGGRETLVVRVEEKPWGPNYLRTGIGLETRYNNPSVFLLFNYTRRWVNERGAEWRNDIEFGSNWGIESEWYQPRGYDKIGFFSGSASYKRNSFRVFDGNQAVGEYDVRQFIIRAEGGTQLRTAGEVRFGVFQRWDDAQVEIGLPGFPQTRTNEGGLRASLVVNTQDQPFFPVRGTRGEFELLAPVTWLGADHQYVVANLQGTLFQSVGRHVFSGGLAVHDTFAGTAPAYDEILLGGLGNLSGYAYGQLIGQAGTVVSLGYRNRVTRIPGLSDGVYVGVLAEAGNVYETLSDLDVGHMKTSALVYFGLNTSYGPLLLGAAKSSGVDTQWYIQIGRSF